MYAVVLADLDRAGVADTSLRWLCLKLAHCIDGAPLTASGLSALIKQLMAAMDKALASRNRAPERTPLDLLAARRATKTGPRYGRPWAADQDPA